MSKIIKLEDGQLVAEDPDNGERVPVSFEALEAGSVSTERTRIGTGYIEATPDDGNTGVQSAHDELPDSGGVIKLLSGDWTFTDRVHITKDNIEIVCEEGVEISADDGDWTLTELDSNPNIPDTKSFFVFDDVNSGSIRGGEIDADGFVHDSETDVTAILALGIDTGCENVHVDKVTIKNVFPDSYSEFGPENDNGVEIRYNGVLFFKARHCTVTRSHAENIKYEAFGARGDYVGCSFINNSARQMYEGVQCGSDQYGGSSVNDTIYGSTSHVVASNNWFEEFDAHGLVTHGKNISFVNNDVKDALDDRDGVSPFATIGGSHNIIANNTATDCGQAGVRVEDSIRINISGNVIETADIGVHPRGDTFYVTIVGNSITDVSTAIESDEMSSDGPRRLVISANTIRGTDGILHNADIDLINGNYIAVLGGDGINIDKDGNGEKSALISNNIIEDVSGLNQPIVTGTSDEDVTESANATF